MPQFIVYEIWTKASLVEADTAPQAYEKSEPKPIQGMALSNWHAVEVPRARRRRKV